MYVEELHKGLNTTKLSLWGKIKYWANEKLEDQRDLVMLPIALFVIFIIMFAGREYQLGDQFVASGIFIVLIFLMGLVFGASYLLLFKLKHDYCMEINLKGLDGKYETNKSKPNIIRYCEVINEKMPLFKNIIGALEKQLENDVPDIDIKKHHYVKRAINRFKRQKKSTKDQLLEWASDNKYSVPDKLKKPEEIKQYLIEEKNKRIEAIDELADESGIFSSEREKLLAIEKRKEKLGNFLDTIDWLPVDDTDFKHLRNNYLLIRDFKKFLKGKINIDPLEYREWNVLAFRFADGYKINSKKEYLFKWLFLLIRDTKGFKVTKDNWTLLFERARRFVSSGSGMGYIPNVLMPKGNLHIIDYYQTHGPICTISELNDYQFVTPEVREEYNAKIEIYIAQTLFDQLKLQKGYNENLKKTNKIIHEQNTEYLEDEQEIRREYEKEQNRLTNNQQLLYMIFGGILSLLFYIALQYYGVI